MKKNNIRVLVLVIGTATVYRWCWANEHTSLELSSSDPVAPAAAAALSSSLSSLSGLASYPAAAGALGGAGILGYLAYWYAPRAGSSCNVNLYAWQRPRNDAFFLPMATFPVPYATLSIYSPGLDINHNLTKQIPLWQSPLASLYPETPIRWLYGFNALGRTTGGFLDSPFVAAIKKLVVNETLSTADNAMLRDYRVFHNRFSVFPVSSLNEFVLGLFGDQNKQQTVGQPIFVPNSLSLLRSAENAQDSDHKNRWDLLSSMITQLVTRFWKSEDVSFRSNVSDNSLAIFYNNGQLSSVNMLPYANVSIQKHDQSWMSYLLAPISRLAYKNFDGQRAYPTLLQCLSEYVRGALYLFQYQFFTAIDCANDLSYSQRASYKNTAQQFVYLYEQWALAAIALLAHPYTYISGTIPVSQRDKPESITLTADNDPTYTIYGDQVPYIDVITVFKDIKPLVTVALAINNILAATNAGSGLRFNNAATTTPSGSTFSAEESSRKTAQAGYESPAEIEKRISGSGKWWPF